jgi:FkbM family methyltransferase
MKLRDLIYLLGLRGRPQTYSWETELFELPREGAIPFAQWQHPRQQRTVPTQEVVDELRTFIRPGDFAIDIGAQVGDTTIPMGLATGRHGAVLALEPNRYVYPVLCENVRLNAPRTQFFTRMLAAAEQTQELEFEYSDAGFCNGGCHANINRWRHGHAYKLRVQGVRLETLLQADFNSWLPRLRFIKTDCEGFDLHVLRTMENILRAYRPYLKVEVYRHASEAYRHALLAFLRHLGYRPHCCVSETHLRGPVVLPGDVMNWSHYDLFCVPVNAE